MRRFLFILPCALVLTLLVGCGDDDEDTASTPAEPAEPAGPSVPDVSAGSWTEAAPARPWLVVGYHDIRLGEGEPIVALEDRRVPVSAKSGGADGYLVPALHERLRAAAEGEGPLGLAIDPEIPYRTLSEVIYTAGQADRFRMAFVVRRGDELAALPIELPSLAPRTASTEEDRRRVVDEAREHVDQMLLGALGNDDGALHDVLRGDPTGSADDVLAQAEGVEVATSDDEGSDPPPSEIPEVEPAAAGEAAGARSRIGVGLGGGSALNLTVTVTADGLIVSGSGGKLAPGCERTQTGRVITVPVRDGVQDLEALTRCLERVHAENPDDDQVIISADSAIVFRDVARVIAATRGTPERPLFDRTLLVAGVR